MQQGHAFFLSANSSSQPPLSRAMSRRPSRPEAHSVSDEADETPSPPSQHGGSAAAEFSTGVQGGIRLKDADGADISGSADDHQIMAILAHVSSLVLAWGRGRGRRFFQRRVASLPLGWERVWPPRRCRERARQLVEYVARGESHRGRQRRTETGVRPPL